MQRYLLYTHGYITATFGALGASPYLTRLLQFDESLLQLHFTPETEAFIINPAFQHAQPSTYNRNRPAWPVDYKVREQRGYGSVVPQSNLGSGTPDDAQHYNNVSLKMPIFFIHSDRKTLGLPLIRAEVGDYAGLLNAHAPAPVGNSHTIFIPVKVSVSQVAHSGPIVKTVSTSSGLATTKGDARL